MTDKKELKTRAVSFTISEYAYYESILDRWIEKHGVEVKLPRLIRAAMDDLNKKLDDN